MSDVDFEDRDTSILCYDGLCDHCEDQLCEHRCHYRDLTWKRRLEAGFLRLGIFALPTVLAMQFIDGFAIFLVSAVMAGVASFLAEWFEKDWEDAS